MIFKELRSARARPGKGAAVGFTGELHRFYSGQIFFFRQQAVRSEANIDAVNTPALINIQTKQALKHRPIGMLVDACKYRLSESLSTVAGDHRELQLQRSTCDRMCESMRADRVP